MNMSFCNALILVINSRIAIISCHFILFIFLSSIDEYSLKTIPLYRSKWIGSLGMNIFFIKVYTIYVIFFIDMIESL